MLPAIPVFMEVRPFQVSHLCFEMGGILQESIVELGTEVSAFDFGDFYAKFRKAEDTGEFNSDRPIGRLVFQSGSIDFTIRNFKGLGKGVALATLRAEAQRAALDKAINARSNAFITKYSGVAAIADVMRKILPLRGQSINRLSELSDGMKRVLETAYTNANRTGAVTTTESQSDTKGSNGGTLKTVNDADPPGSHAEPGSTQTSSTTATESQHITTTNVDFRAPIFENDAQNERAQISLGQEIISFVMDSHYLDERLEKLFAQELASIDPDVNRLQVAFLNTFLMSPIDGTVTGVYKYPGDSVSAGEPVFRVENNAIVLIVAKVVCRGPVLIGSILSITTTLFDGTGSPVSLSAAIVSARGQGDDDQWEVIGKVSNVDTTGNKIFPLGYRFDIDSAITQVSILAPNEV